MNLLDLLLEELRGRPESRREVALLLHRELAQLEGGAEIDAWLDSAEAATYLRVSRDYLNRLASAGDIPSRQKAPNAKRFFLRDELDQWRDGTLPAPPMRRVA